ncbi:Bax inhibitor-1/YccA family protein [Aliikangiella sp. IMCC44359]|uniref:Bax inhibitor-1/YccA family protein n=1 Tax=Aliikangiella sp. IMCC44359 TaxID=3459125 RepID=UPI00403ADFF9
MQQNSPVIERTRGHSIEINKVLKNTYLLLSATLLFSAAMAGLAVMMNVSPINPFIYLAVIFGISFLLSKTADSPMGLVVTFAFTGFLGFYAGPIVSIYASTFGSQIVVQALAGTGLIFFALSGYVLTTKKDFTFLRGFLFVGLMVGIVASIGYLIASYFFGLHISGLSLALSALFVILMSGFILYDTSSIMRGEQTNYIIATVSMYMNIYVLFMHLLNLLSAFSGDD